MTLFSDVVEDWLVERRSELAEASADRYEYLMRKFIGLDKREMGSVVALSAEEYSAPRPCKEYRHGSCTSTIYHFCGSGRVFP